MGFILKANSVLTAVLKMDADAEEIWRDRLRKDVDVDEIIDEETLQEEINDLPSFISGRNISGAKRNLLDHIGTLVDNSSSLQSTIINNVDRLEDFDKLRKVARTSPEFRLIARQRGINYSKEVIKRNRFSSEADDAFDFLREYSPQTLGGITRQDLRRSEGLRELF